jgi:glyoxylase-like metal-dependent hydrolase (beta-lactamase superfamily II)
MKRILYFAVVWMCISTVSHAVQPAPETIAESEKTLFGKLKLWEIEKISPHLYAYRYTFYRNFFLIGEDGIILTDPLTIEAAKILDTELRKISDKPIKYVAYSHSHWDHISGGQIFKDQGAEFVAHKKCQENWLNNPNSNVVKPDIVFDKIYTISVGTPSLEMHYWGPSHDNCRVGLLIKPDRIMFIADDANPPNGWNMLYGAGLADTYIFNLVPFFLQAEKLAAREDVKSVIGSHMSFDKNPMNLVSGTIGSVRIIREQRLFYQNVIEAVEKAMANGIPNQEIPDYLIEEKVLTDKIIGYDVAKMKVLYKRITNFLITGE